MLEFQPIDLERHQDLCVRFRADSFVCSFGSNARFYEEDGNGAERYLQWLKQRIAEIPNSCVHVWQAEQIVGQLEMRRWQRDSSVGYVNLFYLIPEFRGQGLGRQLDRYAANFFRQLGCRSARLSVSPTNPAAIEFYLKQGWKDLGRREDTFEVHYFEKTYEVSNL
jgi:ribosomal protein S18 acetylase RimI-like enzyme